MMNNKRIEIVIAESPGFPVGLCVFQQITKSLNHHIIYMS
jgi:hypothetical protein